MTPLGRTLARRIAAEGPMSVADFMAACLADPAHGYYRRMNPFGAAGDFVTAPETSQMFGELLGLWAAQVWEMLGRPSPVIVAELGPGSGALMADARRAIAKVAPAFAAAMRLHLVEINRTLREAQARALAGATAVWHDTHATLPDGPLIVVANEFLDALPVHQYQRDGAIWRERQVVLSPVGDGFVFAAGSAVGDGDALRLRADAPDGAISEMRPAANEIATWVARRLVAGSGAALFVDYGSAASGLGDTLQAVRRHRPVDPLSDPGEVDLTAHVDFQSFGAAASTAGARVDGPVPQAHFLRRLGIDARAASLLRTATPAQARSIEAGYRTLIDASRMGTLFKAIALTTPQLPTLPGFDSAA